MSRGILKFLVATVVIASVNAVESTGPLLADGLAPQFVSYSPGAPSLPQGSTKEIKMACYPVHSECTKNSDCCSGVCRDWHGHAFYCYPKGW
jgi:hypothetical protein